MPEHSSNPLQHRSPVDKVAVNVQEVFCFSKTSGLFFLYPQHLCGCVGRVEVKAGNLKHACRINRLGYLGSLPASARRSEPNDAVHKCIAVLVGRYDGVVYCVHADRSDLGRVNAGIGNESCYNGGERSGDNPQRAALPSRDWDIWDRARR